MQKHLFNIKMQENCFTYFNTTVNHINTHIEFTFPFYYTPNILSTIASEEIQKIIPNNKELGRMYGVLVVKNTDNELGYIWAVSGKQPLINKNKAVPPIFELSDKSNFFGKEEDLIHQITLKIDSIERESDYLYLKKLFETESINSENKINEKRLKMVEAKKNRKKERIEASKNLNKTDLELILKRLSSQSIINKKELLQLKLEEEQKIENINIKLSVFENELNSLKEERKQRSITLQNQLFEEYNFLNIKGETKNAIEMFKDTPYLKPPSGTGDCAAPKLLQYAFKNDLKPIAMAEFWWGKAPMSQIRKHGNYYPACTGKCGPILEHMLKHMKVEKNLIIENLAKDKTIEIILDDPNFAVINKPAELLSVPGKQIKDSIYSRIKTKYPEATGPIIIHRLDMSTSGIMIIAKNKNTHKAIQEQFISRSIKKRYIAVLNGKTKELKGEVNLPLKVDFNERPKQMVCYKDGKNTLTKWEVIKQNDKETRIHFYPITGRTHQLRMHSSHYLGLDCPIKGDDLYGTKSDRLYLHAQDIEFRHPITKKTIIIHLPAEF
ncbi:MAG: RluA family pseudouridine synthase [Flavobacteriaceae bacterium]|nr:RluA family pseudouridine synthase [Flavobacteriaceae bacterium]